MGQRTRAPTPAAKRDPEPTRSQFEAHERRCSRLAWFTVKSRPGYIGGVIPSRPTSTTAASQVPSEVFAHAGTNTLAPGFRSALSPGIKLTTIASDGMTIVFSPSLYFSVSVLPSCLVTCCVTAALVIELPGMRSQG